jgi:DNA-binding beta-propeller fold protein YncE
MDRRDFLALTGAAIAMSLTTRVRAERTRRFLYVAEPGIRNYVEYGGIGVLVYDIDKGYEFIRRIPTFTPTEGRPPENVKGIAASARTGRLYVTAIGRLGCIDLASDRLLWQKELEGGCDRLAISPDGALLYVPSFEGPHWNVVDGLNGERVAKVVTNSGAHNTVYARDGSRVYLAGLRSPELSIADPKTHTVVRTVGPFSHSIRPFTVNADQTLCYVNVNELLGFEIGDIRTGRKLHRVEVQGYEKGPVKRHGCPSHGIGLTPDERELWLCDGHNNAMHVFDNTVMPPKQIATIPVRDQPGWISFSIDGARAYPSTGEVFNTGTKQRIVALQDEVKRDVGSEKLLEIVFDGTRPVRTGDQFGVGVKQQSS